MFGTIRKHQTWLWAVIITLTVISFVVYFSPYSRMNNNRGGGSSYGVLNGESISQEQFMRAEREVSLQVFFNSGGRWPEQFNEDMQRETYKWLLLVQAQERMRINVGKEAAGLMARNLVASLQRLGVDSTATFIDKVLPARGLNVDDFDRFCRHYFGVQELMATVGASGKLLTPQEAKAMYERNHQEVATEAVFFNPTNFVSKVTATPEGVAHYYTNEMAKYRIPERVQVRYVEFNLSNYLGQAEAQLKTNLNEMVDAYFQRLGTNYTELGKTPELAKAKIRDRFIQGQAMENARRKAQEFIGKLDELTIDTKSADVIPTFDALARTNGLTAKLSPPFDRNDAPESMDVGPDFVRAAFALSSDQPLAPVVKGETAAYAFAFAKRLPSESPSFDQIKPRVITDYKLLQATNQAWQAAYTFYSSLTNGMGQGKSFSELCAGAQVKPVSLAPFSIGSQQSPDPEDRVNLSELKQVAFSTPVGKVSTPALGLDGFFILHVKNKLPLDLAKEKVELPAYTSVLRQRRSQEAFNLWFGQQAQKAFRNFEIFQQRTPPSLGSARS